jgi:4-amino-4-deoxy-L-arabinose transferase-like glycosyltransferase
MGAGHEVEIAPGPGTRAFASGWSIVAVLVVATALRLAYLADLARTPWWTQLVVDPEYYDDWARRIAAGDWLGTRAFYMDPLYPYLLGAVYRLGGHDLWLARLVNVACSVGACGATLLLGRRIGGRLVGVLAGLGLALYEPDIFSIGEIDKTSLSMLLVATFLLLFATGPKRPARRAAAGFVLGLAILTRANLLLFVPLGALVIALDRGDGRRVAGACGFVLGTAAALTPVTWRNHHVSGEWVLTTTQLGQNFFTGNNPENPYGAYGVVSFVRANPHFEEEDFRAAAEARVGHALRPGAISWFWFRAGLDHIVAEPMFALRAFARKAALFWNDFEISDSSDQYLAARDARVLRLPLLGFGEVAAFAVLGALAAARRSRAVRLLTAYVVLYGATLVVFFLFARYRIQVVPALLPLAALGVVEAVSRVRARDPRRIAVAAAVVAMAGAASFATIGIFSVDHPNVVEMRMRHLADAYMSAGDPDRAIAALDEAVPNCTHGCPWALADLFAIYQRTGRFEEGVRYFERFARVHPEQRDVPQYLADLRARVAAPSGAH